jgi:Ulp1 family protease
MDTLSPGEWLSDSIVRFYMLYIEREIIQEQADRERCLIMDSYFWRKLSQVPPPPTPHSLPCAQSYRSTRIWVK